MSSRFTCCLLAGLAITTTANAADPADKITHGLLITGGETYIRDGAGKTLWSYPHSTRDGWVLDNGNLLLALSTSKEHPHGAAVEVTRDNKVVWSFEGTQSEVNTVQALPDGRVLVTEAGNKPRILEVDRAGKVVVEVPIDAQIKDHHLQTRYDPQTGQRQLSRPAVARQGGAGIFTGWKEGVGGQNSGLGFHRDSSR